MFSQSPLGTRPPSKQRWLRQTHALYHICFLTCITFYFTINLCHKSENQQQRQQQQSRDGGSAEGWSRRTPTSSIPTVSHWMELLRKVKWRNQTHGLVLACVGIQPDLLAYGNTCKVLCATQTPGIRSTSRMPHREVEAHCRFFLALQTQKSFLVFFFLPVCFSMKKETSGELSSECVVMKTVCSQKCQHVQHSLRFNAWNSLENNQMVQPRIIKFLPRFWPQDVTRNVTLLKHSKHQSDKLIGNYQKGMF